MDLITLKEYKDYYSMSDNPKEDSKISLLINSVSGLIQAYIGMDFEGGKMITETLSIDYDTNIIYLEHYPVSSIVSVSESDRYTLDSTIHVPLVYASDYILNQADGTLIRQYTPGGFANWPLSPGVITVSYITGTRAGTGTSDGVPADLKLACIELVSYYKNEEFKQSKTISGTSVVNTTTKGEDFPQYIQVILDKYR